MRAGWLVGLLGLAAAALSPSAALAGPDGTTLDVATLRCSAFVELEAADAATFRALVGWLDGWLNAEKASASYAPAAQAEQARRWLERCRAEPARPVLDLVRSGA